MGHLSNDAMADFLIQDLDPATRHLVLGHLSEHNNNPYIVDKVASQSIEQRGLSTTLAIAKQREPSEVFQL